MRVWKPCKELAGQVQQHGYPVTQLRQQQNSVLSTLNALNKANSDD